MTHTELVKLATQWAKGRHDVVLEERSSGNGELPDIMAFSYRWSTQIEVKVSRADFLSDKKKLTRQNGDCLGNYRIYCCPKGMLIEDDIPETWGLLEYYPSGFMKLRTNLFKYAPGIGTIWWHELSTTALKHERFMLFRALQDIAEGRETEKIGLQLVEREEQGK